MLKVTELRKIYSAQGIKGFGSANRETFNADIHAAHELALLSEASRESAKQVKPVAPKAPKAPKAGLCEDCGRKVGKSGHPTLCTPCHDYAGWQNTHADGSHSELAEMIESGAEEFLADFQKAEREIMGECPVCHPALDPRTAKANGRSRMGMVIIAKGSEIHKSETFRAAAKAAGWSVEILGSVITEEEDGEEIERYVAIASRDGDVIELAWNGRAYDYPGSSAHLGDRSRKVRNLKEALRLL